MEQVQPDAKSVEARDDGSRRDEHSGPLIEINVSHGSAQHDIHVPPQSTFGCLKRLIEEKTGVDPKRQKILFRGQEREDGECLDVVGVKDRSKVLVVEEPVVEEEEEEEEEVKEGGDDVSSKVEVKESDEEMLKALKAIDDVRSEVDKLADRVDALEASVNGETKVAEEEFVVSAELLMRQLLKLDAVEAGGDARIQRKAEVQRIQNLHEVLDTLKARNAKPFSDSGNAAAVTTEWETFDSAPESAAHPPPAQSSTRITQEWERFD